MSLPICASGQTGQMGHDMSEHASGDGMEMYTARPLSGCKDYHCLKCTTRDQCSTESRCDMPGCGHDHAVVECHGCSVLYLRSREGFASCVDRAASVVTKMNSATAKQDPEKWHYVVKKGEQTWEVWLEMIGMSHGDKIVSVTNADVAGYRHRAKIIPMSYDAESIDKRLVASWWAALLQDHFDAMILGNVPRLTVKTHCGKPLLKAFKAARAEEAEGRISMATWHRVFSRELSPTDRDRLGLVAQIIPKSFLPSSDKNVEETMHQH